MENPLISIIVPVYNVEKYLDKCVQSIVNQTYTNLEIILIDDGSPDNCPKMCDEWAEKDSRVKVIHKENGGLSSARNIGLAEATGELLGFVDSDDWIALDLVEKAVVIFNTQNPDIVEFDAHCVNEKGELFSSTENIKEGILSPKDALNELLRGNINNFVCNKVFKKKIFSGVLFPENRIFEDMAIMYRLFLNSEKIYCIPDKLYYYYQRNGSTSKTIGGKELCDLFLARYECYITIKDKYPEAEKISFNRVALCALRLYDRALWETVNEEVLESAKLFLSKNKDAILKSNGDIKYRLYYYSPAIYSILRIFKHKIGNIVKFIKKK